MAIPVVRVTPHNEVERYCPNCRYLETYKGHDDSGADAIVDLYSCEDHDGVTGLQLVFCYTPGSSTGDDMETCLVQYLVDEAERDPWSRGGNYSFRTLMALHHRLALLPSRVLREFVRSRLHGDLGIRRQP